MPIIKDNVLNLKKELVILKDVITVLKMMNVSGVDKDMNLPILQIQLVHLFVMYKIASPASILQNVTTVLMDMFLQIQEAVF